jgi:hypothetical protein
MTATSSGLHSCPARTVLFARNPAVAGGNPMLPVVDVHCPYCGEPLALTVDVSAGDHSYIEDCAVCCRPMVVAIRVADAGDFAIAVHRDDEA